MGDLTLLLAIFIGVSIILYFLRFKGWWIILIAGFIIFLVLRWAINGTELGEDNKAVLASLKETFSEKGIRNLSLF